MTWIKTTNENGGDTYINLDLQSVIMDSNGEIQIWDAAGNIEEYRGDQRLQVLAAVELRAIADSTAKLIDAQQVLAAPDMFTALLIAGDFIDSELEQRLTGGEPDSDYVKAAQEAADAVHAAIQKARGK